MSSLQTTFVVVTLAYLLVVDFMTACTDSFKRERERERERARGEGVRADRQTGTQTQTQTDRDT